MDAAEFANEIAYQVIGCAVEVLKVLGAGLLEATYQRAMHIDGLRRYVRDPGGRYALHVNVQPGL